MNDINLKQIIEQFPDCVTNGAKLKAILLDTYPEISKAMVNTLVIMANSGIAKEIKDSANITELDKSRWHQKLEDEGFSEKVICSCLNMVFIAFGLNTACISNDEKLVVESSLSIQTKSVFPPTNLPDFEIKGGVLVKYIGKSSDVTIPDGVKTIIGYAFKDCRGLTSVTIGNSVTCIDDYAFEGCRSLTSVTIGNGVTHIMSYAFKDCRGLTSVTIGNGVTYIGNNAFSDCSGLKSIYYTGNFAGWCGIEGLVNITSSPRTLYIGGKKLEGDLVIPDSVTSIGSFAFRNCSGLTSVTIPNSVTSIGQWAFWGCSGLTSVTIGNGVTYIGNNAFIDCSGLTSVTIGNSVTCIDDYAFKGCSGIANMVIPDRVTCIGSQSFMGCRKLKNVVIPNSVTYIGNWAFSGCSDLSKIIFNGTIEKWNNINKEIDYLKNTAIKAIHCSDGIIHV